MNSPTEYWPRIVAVIVLVLAISLGGFIYFTESEEDQKPLEGASMGEGGLDLDVSEEELKSSFYTLLDIFHSLYFVSKDNLALEDAESTSEFVVIMTREALDDNAELERVELKAPTLIQSDNEVIKTVGQGAWMSMQMMKEANNEWLTYLRGFDSLTAEIAEFQYQSALLQSQQKEAFKTLVISAGAFSGLFWEFAETENPSGPIPYKMSNQTREDMLNRIDYLFSDAFEEDRVLYGATGNKHSIVFILEHFIDSLKYDTYEEAAANT